MKSSKLVTHRAPFLRHIAIAAPERPSHYPHSIPAFAAGVDVELDRRVTILVGENGSGKSTLLEAIAEKAGFNVEGGNRDHRFATRAEAPGLAPFLRLSWFPKVTRGFFFRAESFYNLGTYLDDVGAAPSNGRSFHHQSHGESFLALFRERFRDGLFLLDEPEAALSPQRQLSLLCIIHGLEEAGRSQFLIASHSPILLAYPSASLLSLDGGGVHSISYEDSPQFQLMKGFIENRDRFFRHLFAADGPPST